MRKYYSINAINEFSKILGVSAQTSEKRENL